MRRGSAEQRSGAISKRAFLTGATGFIGAAIARRLAAEGFELCALARPQANRANLAGLKLELIEGDLRDVPAFAAHLRGCDALFHCAADYRMWARDPQEIYASNVGGAAALLEAAWRAGVERIVYTSSVGALAPAAARGAVSSEADVPPGAHAVHGHYHRSKYLGEQEALRLAAAGAPVVIVNPTMPMGPGDVKPTPTGRILRAAAAGLMPAYLDTGMNVVHVDDVAEGHLLALRHGAIGARYVLGGENLWLKDLLEMVQELTGQHRRLLKLNRRALYPLAYAAEGWARLTGAAPFVTVEEIAMAEEVMHFSSRRAIEELGYRPRPALEAVQDALAWNAAHPLPVAKPRAGARAGAGGCAPVFPSCQTGVFVVGTGRCGSTMLSALLRSHPRILSLSELLMALASRAFVGGALDGEAFWRKLTRASPAVRRSLNPRWCPEEFLYPLGQGRRHADIKTLPPISYIALPHLSEDPDGLCDWLEPQIRSAPRASLSWHYRRLFALLCQRFEKSLWVERSGGSILLLPAIRKHFPGAKIVHMVRDGRSCAPSIARHAPMRLLAHSWRGARRFGIDLFRPPFRVGDSAMIAAMEPLAAPFASSAAALARPIALEDAGRYWSAMVLAGLEEIAKVPPAQLHTLRYEDLLARPAQELERLAAFFGPDYVDRDWIAAAAQTPRAPAAPPPCSPQLAAACAPGLQALGYPV